MTYEEKRFAARDGLGLYYRDYAFAASGLTPVLCLSGTTQNAKVYTELAEHLAQTRRVLSMTGVVTANPSTTPTAPLRPPPPP